ncbi:MAG: type II toxin-antitoxin system Phd/YefM family antitoxin [Planctomycetes bacterium]|nr:type II toxin-antitoxin system Phd/YefM family antitoxin [Planctomycetota bacterium]
MKSVGVETLKSQLSEYLRLIAAGESLLVTDGGRVVAELIPPRQAGSALAPDSALAGAVRKGWVTPAAASTPSPPPRLPVDRMANILEELNVDRAER